MKFFAAFAAVLTLFASCRMSPETVQEPQPAFRDVARETGLVFHHRNGARGKFHLPEIMGSGVGLLDYDRDGDLDVYFVQGDPEAGGNRMFRNELVPSGHLQFTDVSNKTRTAAAGWGMGVAVGDYDADGDPDLLVTNFGRNVLYRNDGAAFTDVTAAARVGSDGWHTSASFVDYDRDGDLDLFVSRYLDFSLSNAKVCHGASGHIDYCTPKAYRPVMDRLFRNEGDGTFRDVSVPAGLGEAIGPGLGVISGDFDGDQWPDIYVANDGEANHLWLNQRNGTFRNAALETGLAFSEDGVPLAGMGIAAGDFDNDEDEDIVVTNLRGEGATLYRNEGRGIFSDVSAQIGLRGATLPYTGFGTALVDYDSDGCLDLFVANGAVTIIDSQRGEPRPFRQRSQILKGNCKTFSESVGFGDDVGRGAAFGDIDNDGDVDIVVSNNAGSARLLLNETRQKPWLRVEASPGSTVTAIIAGRRYVRTVRSDGSYLSASAGAVLFPAVDMRRLEIRWPDGRREAWSAIKPNQAFVPVKGSGVPLP